MSNHFYNQSIRIYIFMIVFIFKNSVNIVVKYFAIWHIFKAISNLRLNKCPYLRGGILMFKKQYQNTDSGFVITLYADSQSLASVIKNS
jgi:hypothetical protein